MLTALEKLPADRFPTAQAFADALEGKAGATPIAWRGTGGGAPRSGWRGTLRNPAVWVMAVVALAALGVALRERRAHRDSGSVDVVRFAVEPPAGTQASLADAGGPALAVSPDGSTVAFPAIDRQGGRRLYVRRMDDATARAVQGTDGAYSSIFSADGASLLFWRAGRLEEVALAGGATRVLAELGQFTGNTRRLPGGDILFALPAAPRLTAYRPTETTHGRLRGPGHGTRRDEPVLPPGPAG